MADPIKEACLADLKVDLQHDIDGFTSRVKEHLRNNGNTCAESQQMCFLNLLSDLQAHVNGLSVDDIN